MFVKVYLYVYFGEKRPYKAYPRLTGERDKKEKKNHENPHILMKG